MSESEKLITRVNISREDIENLFTGKVLGIRVPSLLSGEALGPALERIHGLLKDGSRWYMDRDKQIPSDMGYLMAIPRHRARLEPELIPLYLKQAQGFAEEFDNLFSPGISPLTKLQKLFEKAFGKQIPVEKFDGDRGLPAIIRYMVPENFLEDCPDGICHIDQQQDFRLITANLYLSVPSTGGELKIWDYDVQSQPRSAISRLIKHHAFDPGLRDKIQHLLPPPLIVKMRPGDLFLFDAGKPHAVASFSEGTRMSLQTFLKIREDNQEDIAFSS
jgi:hypothetical protein